MRKLLLLLPLMAAGLFMTGCDEVYAERTVVYDSGPGYHGDDFYYVSSRPYSRAYGPLYLRGGRYYYSRGGTYVVYDRGRRPSYRSDRDRDRGRDRRDWDRDRDRARDRARRDRDDDRRRSSQRTSYQRTSSQSRAVERRPDRRVDLRRNEPRVRTEARRNNVVKVRSNNDGQRRQFQQTVVRRNADGDRARSSDRGSRGDRGDRGDRGRRDRDRG